MSEPKPEKRVIRLVRKDSTGRINLGKAAAHKFYHVYSTEDGMIVLKPVVPHEPE